MKTYTPNISLNFKKCDKFTQVYLGKILAFIYNPMWTKNRKKMISVTSFIEDMNIIEIAQCYDVYEAKSVCVERADMYIKQLSS